MHRAVAVVVVADRAVEQVITEDALERPGAGAASARGEDVTTSIPSAATVPQARTRLPSTSTMQVSQVWIGPS